jgi:hypothetical protein
MDLARFAAPFSVVGRCWDGFFIQCHIAQATLKTSAKLHIMEKIINVSETTGY